MKYTLIFLLIVFLISCTESTEPEGNNHFGLPSEFPLEVGNAWVYERHYYEWPLPHGEGHFFDNDRLFAEGVCYDKYHRLFSAEDLNRTAGDITPIYIYWSPCIERIYEYNPRMKFIISLRSPIDRSYSHWQMERSRDEEHDSFSLSVLKELAFGWLHGQNRVRSYVRRGFYSQQLKKLFKFFPRNQVLVLKNEFLLENHEESMRSIFEFLGVDKTILPEHKMVHHREYDPMPSGVRQMLKLVFRRDIEELERLLDWDCSDWLR